MKKNKNFFIITLTLIVFVAIVLLSSTYGKAPMRENNGRVNVVTSFYPIYYFAKEIGGDYANVYNLTPAGAEPHDYEPTTGDISKIHNSQLLIINGGGLEGWAPKVKEDLGSRNIPIVETGTGIISDKDPHVWLDPVLAKDEVNKIAQGLEKADVSHKDAYEKNKAKLLTDLDELDYEFKNGLADCKQKYIITSHAAFGYLANRYGFTQFSIQGISPDEDPSPQKLAEISDLSKKDHIKYIFYETLVSPRLAATLATEIGAKPIEFNPLEGLSISDINDGEDYFTVQRQNLENLRVALECK